MLDELFGSKTRAALLGALLETPGESIHLRELVRRSGGSISGVQRELERLEGMGLVHSEAGEGGRREISLVSTHPLAAPLAGLIAAEESAPYVVAAPVQPASSRTLERLNPRARHLVPRIIDIAESYGVLRLALFGSATQVDVTVVPRDLDVSVRFDPNDRRSRADRVFGLRAELAAACEMKVDLLEADAVENPYLLRELDESEVVLYEAPSGDPSEQRNHP